MALKRFGVSLEDKLLEALDDFVELNGFANRSQGIRFLIEKNVGETKWKCNNFVAGSVIIMYNHNKQEICSKISTIQQIFKDVILSSSVYYLNENFCLQVVTVSGLAQTLTELSDKLIAIKGIKHGKLVMSRAD
ncbi:MAG: nickel-responsive transcriptional regulator NikR [Tannerella sp.]|jgi:CopG family nickel-responsive transcriptional regulator|nr:nickel-responsive transcriptional regulator NikR [Tannerella sp.]